MVPPEPLVLSALSHPMADTAGGDRIEIDLSGTSADYAAGVTVTVGGEEADIDEWSDGWIVFIMPPLPPGMHDVTVTNGGGASNALQIEAWNPTQIPGVVAVNDGKLGVTLYEGKVERWDNRVVGSPYLRQTTPAAMPAYSGDALGPFVGDQILHYSGVYGTVDGNVASIFWVGSWTSTKTTVTSGYGVPLTAFAAAYLRAYGASGGKLAVYPTAYVPPITIGSGGLNDGVRRLLGWIATSSDGASGDLTSEAIVGSKSIGRHRYTAAPWYGKTQPLTVGNGHLGADPWPGDFCASVIIDGRISDADLAKLHAWAAVRFGVEYDRRLNTDVVDLRGDQLKAYGFGRIVSATWGGTALTVVS